MECNKGWCLYGKEATILSMILVLLYPTINNCQLEKQRFLRTAKQIEHAFRSWSTPPPYLPCTAGATTNNRGARKLCGLGTSTRESKRTSCHPVTFQRGPQAQPARSRRAKLPNPQFTLVVHRKHLQAQVLQPIFL